jgi:hypothetical protein
MIAPTSGMRRRRTRGEVIRSSQYSVASSQ